MNRPRDTPFGTYILGGDDGHTPVPVDWETFTAHAQLHATNAAVGPAADPWRVALTTFVGAEVSTMFLGIGHRDRLFETMIFSKRFRRLDRWQARTGTWKEAEAMHAYAVDLVREQLSHAPS